MELSCKTPSHFAAQNVHWLKEQVDRDMDGKYTEDFKHTEIPTERAAYPNTAGEESGWLEKYHYMLILLLDTSRRYLLFASSGKQDWQEDSFIWSISAILKHW